MQMNQQEQKWLVLLYSLIELGGGGRRKTVLQHIQEKGYWYKNDRNDALRTTRNERAWRNDFSYERHHLVERGYMQKGVKGIWQITEPGKAYVNLMDEKVKNMSSEEDVRFTAVFRQKFLHSHMDFESTADQMLLEQMHQSEDVQDEAVTFCSDEPMPKGPLLERSGSKNIYLRDPAVARRALARAGHRCEVDPAHASFRRKNADCLYMEPHHLIPMSMTDEFGVSLDREQNIFSLCSNCHNQIHYGTKEDVRRLLSGLFHSREREISAILGRTITLEDLWRIYKV